MEDGNQKTKPATIFSDDMPDYVIREKAYQVAIIAINSLGNGMIPGPQHFDERIIAICKKEVFHNFCEKIGKKITNFIGLYRDLLGYSNWKIVILEESEYYNISGEKTRMVLCTVLLQEIIL